MASEKKVGNVEPICIAKAETQEVYSRLVKRQLLQVFEEMTNTLSQTNFKEIFTIFEGSGAVVKNEEQIVQTFKDKLYRNIRGSFNDMWNYQDIDLQLNSLNFCKEKCKQNTTSWRPTGKTPEEQTKYLRVHYLKKKIAFMEDVLKLQAESFSATCQEVEAKRAKIEDLIARRDDISKQMDIRMTQINNVDNENIALQKELCG